MRILFPQCGAAAAFAFLLLASPATGADAVPEGRPAIGDIIIGAAAGYAMPTGYYGKRLNGSYRVGLSALYGNPALVKFLMGEMELSYARFPMKTGASSYLQGASLNLGPVFCYPLAPHAQIYTGASAQISYLHLHTERYNKNVRAFKPGLLIRAGMFFPILRGIRLRAGFSYSLHYLSGRPLHGLDFTGGLAYNFNPAERAGDSAPAGDPAAQADWYLALAGKALRDGDIDKAKAHFGRVLALDSNNAEARDRLGEIRKAEEDHARALLLVGEKRLYDALPLLDSAGRILPGARRELGAVRTQLAGDIPALEKRGIELYDRGDYPGCIGVMTRLLQIDPVNRTGQIYLPRARKRQEALERLR